MPFPIRDPAASDPFLALPLFAQALAACRMAHRAALTMLDDPQEQAAAVAACEVLETCIRHADGWSSTRSTAAFERVSQIPRTRSNAAALECLRMAIDSCGAAQGSLDFPVDATVAASAHRAIAALSADPRISLLQVAMLLASDVDQLTFACQEARIGKYDGLAPTSRPPHPPVDVLARLAPIHPLTLSESTGEQDDHEER